MLLHKKKSKLVTYADSSVRGWIGRIFEIPWIDWPDQAEIEGMLVLDSRTTLL